MPPWCRGGAKGEEKARVPDGWGVRKVSGGEAGSSTVGSSEPRFNSQCGPLPALSPWANGLTKPQLPQLKNGGNIGALFQDL